MNCDRNIQTKHEVTKDSLIPRFSKRLGESPTVYANRDENLTSARIDIVTNLLFQESRGFVFQRILEPAAIHERSLFYKANHRFDRIEGIPFSIHQSTQVRPTHSKSIHFSVEILILHCRSFHIT